VRIAATRAKINRDSRTSYSIADSHSSSASLTVFVRFGTHNPSIQFESSGRPSTIRPWENGNRLLSASIKIEAMRLELKIRHRFRALATRYLGEIPGQFLFHRQHTLRHPLATYKHLSPTSRQRVPASARPPRRDAAILERTRTE